MRRLLALSVPLFFVASLVPARDEKKDEKKDEPNAVEQAVIDLTNKEREKEKLPPLKASPALTRLARAHSENMMKSGKFDHVIDGKTPSDRLKAAGYRFAFSAENISKGRAPFGAAEVVQGWMNSAPHKANILNKKLTEVGVGMVRTPNGDVLYTQLFATPLK